MSYELAFIRSLGLTIVIETIVMAVLVIYILKIKSIKLNRIILTGILASAATLPYLWFILPVWFQSKILFHLFGEGSVFLAESVIIRMALPVTYRHALLISFSCNLVSYLTGLLFN